MKEGVKLIPIESIRIVNPRYRDPKKFQAIIRSIKNLGLKKPIQVSLRSAQEGDVGGYDLVAGQGRIEACLALGFKEIAAIVVNASKEDRLLMSLVENMARRFSTHLDLIVEIQRLKAVGHSNAAIGEKLDLGVNMVTGLLTLANKGEERLLEAAIQNKIPVGVAIDISRAEGAEAQRELLKAYEGGQLNQCSIRTLNRLIEQRRHFGKKRDLRKRIRTTADGLVNAYRRETERQTERFLMQIAYSAFTPEEYPTHSALLDLMFFSRLGERLLIQSNCKEAKVKNGDIVEVASWDETGAIKLKDGRQLPAYFRQFTYGYASTSHAAQGKTVDHGFLILGDEGMKAANMRQAYVSNSRFRVSQTIFTTDKKAAFTAMATPAERMLAMELPAVKVEKIAPATADDLEINLWFQQTPGQRTGIKV